MVKSAGLSDCIRISWIMLQLTNDPHSSVTHCRSLSVVQHLLQIQASHQSSHPPEMPQIGFFDLVTHHLNRRPLHSQQNKSYFRQRELRVFHYFSPEIICEFSFTFHWTKLVVRLHL